MRQILYISFLLFSILSFAQEAQSTKKNTSILDITNINVSGIIKDEKGELLVGAIVISKKTKEKTIADFDGKFEINVKQKDKIVISFIGYETKEIKIIDKYYFEIILEVAKRKMSRSEKRMIRREIRKNGSYVFPD